MVSTQLHIVFAGTPDFAVPSLQALANSLHKVIAVYTQPDRPTGRGRKLLPSAIKQCALDLNLPVFQPETLTRAVDIAQLRALKPDLLIVVAYGLLLPQSVLDIPRYGCLNLHASLLPRWRGAAPIQRAMLAGDRVTGNSIMLMEAALDTGPVLLEEQMEIGPHLTGSELRLQLAQAGGTALLRAIEQRVVDGAQGKTQQHELATYAKKVTKADLQVNWAQPAEQILRQIRTFDQKPVSFTYLGEMIIKIWQAAAIHTCSCTGAKPGEITNLDSNAIVVKAGDICVRVTHIQLPGGRAMAVSDVLRGNADLFKVGHKFSLNFEVNQA